MKRSDLRANCSRCMALCCVLTRFDRSPDFACHKAAGEACRHLGVDQRCTIHERLGEEGFPGCISYDCYGAGQHMTALLRGGRLEGVEDLCEYFARVSEIHEMLAKLELARSLQAATALCGEIDAHERRLVALRDGSASAITRRRLWREWVSSEALFASLRELRAGSHRLGGPRSEEPP